MISLYERDSLTILCALERHGYSTLNDLSDQTRIDSTELRRYLLARFPEYWAQDRFMLLAEENPRLYRHLLEDAKFMTGRKVEVNTSKHRYLVFYANYYGFRLTKIDTYPFVMVTRRRDGETFPRPPVEISVEASAGQPGGGDA